MGTIRRGNAEICPGDISGIIFERQVGLLQRKAVDIAVQGRQGVSNYLDGEASFP